VKVRYGLEPEMILIPTGEFLMGSDPIRDVNIDDHEQPQHSLYLPDFYLARTPVTNIQYEIFVEETGYHPPDYWKKGRFSKYKDYHPVVRVSWHDAMAYCRWLSEVSGDLYRLPSEAEWEKGARGCDGRLFPWGNHWNPKLCNAIEGGKPDDTTPVGAFPQGASPYGLLDMAGNVWEWTISLWGSDFSEPAFKYPYDPNDGRENLDADDKTYRILRGGTFNDFPGLVRCAARLWYFPSSRYWDRGFRVAMVAA